LSQRSKAAFTEEFLKGTHIKKGPFLYNGKNMKAIAFFTIFIILCSFSLAGCTEMSDKQERIDQVLAGDPSFTQILTKKKQTDAEIQRLRNQLRYERGVLESEVDELKEKYNSKRSSLNSEIARLKELLDPQRQQIDFQIDNLKTELKPKVKTHKSIKAMAKDAKKLLESKKALGLSEAERGKWRERLSNLSDQSRRLNLEILQLKEKIKVLRFKKRLLKQ